MLTKHTPLFIKLSTWTNEAIKFGWIFQEKVDNKVNLYIHEKCGQKKLTTPPSMRYGKVFCEYCLMEKWKTEANKIGWTWIKKSDKKGYSIYQHSCGHKQSIPMGGIRNLRVACRNCKEQLWQQDAKICGWTWVKQVDITYSLYKHNSCNHHQSIQMGSMRLGRVACHGCQESWQTRPSNLYLIKIDIEDDVTFLKLGIARDVNNRCLRYGLPSHAKVKTIQVKKYKTGKEAVFYEKQIHKTIVLNQSITRYDASHYMTNGHTECYKYSKDAENALLQAILLAQVIPFK
jgi:hypothetical protein